MTDRPKLTAVNQWFTPSEIATIDSLGMSKSRSDFIRTATLRAIWEAKNVIDKEASA